MLEKIDISVIRKTLSNKQSNIKTYLMIMSNLHKVNVSKDNEFQKKFTWFYGMRYLQQSFRTTYYDYMEEHKSCLITFEDVLMYLYNSTSRVEASFSSKMLATINPNMPIWDTNVLSQLSITPPRYNQKDRLKQLKEAVKKYAIIEDWYINYLKTQNAKDVLDVFDEMFPNIQMTDVKKIDWALWSMGEKT